MKKLISNYKTKTTQTELGEWEETKYKEKCRVAFQSFKIFVGDFDPSKNPIPEFSLRRVFDADYNPSHNERLNSIVPDDSEVARQYYSNMPRPSNNPWPTLKDPAVYKVLPQFSPAVGGVTVLKDHDGVILDYSYNVNQQQLDKDLELAVQIYEKIRQM